MLIRIRWSGCAYDDYNDVKLHILNLVSCLLVTKIGDGGRGET